MSMTRRTFAAAATSALAPFAITHAQSTPVATPVDTGVEADLLALMADAGVPGAVIAVQFAADAEPTYYELGVANLQTQAPVTRDMHFRIASVTKTFVATVVLQLVDEGRISLDDTVATILPDVHIANADIITVRNLLQMRSGLAQLAVNPAYTDMLVADVTREVPFEQIVGLIADIPAAAEPDTVFDYNNVNFDLLGEMIHVTTGETWDQAVIGRIAEPLGLSSLQYPATAEMPAPFANGYGYDTEEIDGVTPPASPEALATPIVEMTPVDARGAYDLTQFHPSIAGAAGGLVGNVTDLLTWSTALANGDMISAASHAAQIDAMPVDATGQVGYGMGVLNFSGLIAHNGAINGYQSAVASAPEIGLSVAVLTNAYPTIGFADAALGLVAELLS